MEEILVMLLLVVLALLPVLLIALDIVFAVKKKERPIFELSAFFVGGIYVMFAYILWDVPDYTTSLNVYGTPNMHEPFAMIHMPAVMVFAVWGFLSYFVLKFGRKKLPPLVEVFLLAGLYVGCGLSCVWLFQLLCGARPSTSAEFPGWKVGPYGNTFDMFMMLCLCVVPILFLIHAIHLLVRLIKERAEKQAGLQYQNPLLQKMNQWLLQSINLFWVAFLTLVPVLGVLVMLLCLFGQQPDSIILAFTQTSDWVLSKEIAPPPVAYDTHYLCTVSLRGHRKLVKPIRFGMRRGEKIVVNRQLCVANAFEQLIEERAPKFHRAVRQFYDTYGYPISRHINHAWSADIVYLMMKPLEWIFVAVLYLFDEKPENRICSQYLPKE